MLPDAELDLDLHDADLMEVALRGGVGEQQRALSVTHMKMLGIEFESWCLSHRNGTAPESPNMQWALEKLVYERQARHSYSPSQSEAGSDDHPHKQRAHTHFADADSPPHKGEKQEGHYAEEVGVEVEVVERRKGGRQAGSSTPPRAQPPPAPYTSPRMQGKQGRRHSMDEDAEYVERRAEQHRRGQRSEGGDSAAHRRPRRRRSDRSQRSDSTRSPSPSPRSLSPASQTMDPHRLEEMDMEGLDARLLKLERMLHGGGTSEAPHISDTVPIPHAQPRRFTDRASLYSSRSPSHPREVSPLRAMERGALRSTPGARRARLSYSAQYRTSSPEGEGQDGRSETPSRSATPVPRPTPIPHSPFCNDIATDTADISPSNINNLRADVGSQTGPHEAEASTPNEENAKADADVDVEAEAEEKEEEELVPAAEVVNTVHTLHTKDVTFSEVVQVEEASSEGSDVRDVDTDTDTEQRTDLSVASVRPNFLALQFAPPSPTLSSADLSFPSISDDDDDDDGDGSSEEASPSPRTALSPPPLRGARVSVATNSAGPWMEGKVLASRNGNMWVQPDGWHAAAMFKHIKLVGD